METEVRETAVMIVDSGVRSNGLASLIHAGAKIANSSPDLHELILVLKCCPR